MRSAYCGAVLAVLLGVPACGTPPPLPAAPPTPPAAPPPVVVAVAEPDLSPVAEPKNLIALGRLRNAAALMSGVEKAARLPISIRQILEHEIGDREVASVIKFDASVDFASVLDPSAREPDALFTVSIPMTSLDQAKSIAERDGKVSLVRPGVWRIGSRGGRDVACYLSVSVGDAPARLVCGKRERDVDALLPWMTRGMPTANLGSSDVHLEVRLGPVRDKVKPFIDENAMQAKPAAAMFVSRQFGISDPALLGVVGDVVDEGVALSNDLEGFVLDASLDADAPQSTVKGALKFRSGSSWLVKALTARADKAGPPPAMYWQLPKDADSASFGRGSDPKMFEGIRRGLATVVGSLSRSKLPDAEAKAISDLFSKLPIAEGASVLAMGPPPVAASGPGTKVPTAPEALGLARTSWGRVLGWGVFGYEGKPELYGDWLRDLVKTYNRPALQSLMKGGGGRDKVMPTLKAVAAPAGSPPGSLAVELAIPITSHDVWSEVAPRGSSHPAGAAAKGFITTTIVVMPDGVKSWVVIAADPAILKDKLAALKTGAPKEATLASRDGLTALGSSSNTSGGYVTLHSVVGGFGARVRMLSSRRERKMGEMLAAVLPNKGETPVLLLGSATAGATPSVSFEVKVEKGTIADLASAATFLATKRRQRNDDAESPSMDSAPMPPVAPPPRPRKK